jgi:hypothetical protein
MPDKALTEKLSDAPNARRSRKEHDLAEEQELDRGIMPRALRNILLVTGVLVVFTALLYVVILQLPRGRQTAEQIPHAEVPVQEIAEEEGVSATIAEGRTPRVLGASIGPVTQRARAFLKTEAVTTRHKTGVIPHPYLQQTIAYFTATATREYIGTRTIFTVTTELPKIPDNEQYTVYLFGGDETRARALGPLVRQGTTLFSMTAVEPFISPESSIAITCPDPKDSETTVTLLSGSFTEL